MNKQKCDSGTKKECREIWREERRPYTDQECWNQPLTLCEQVWVNSGNGQKDWVDDPSTCRTQNQVDSIILKNIIFDLTKQFFFLLRKNVEQSQSTEQKKSETNNVRMCPGKNAETFQRKNAIGSPNRFVKLFK